MSGLLDEPDFATAHPNETRSTRGLVIAGWALLAYFAVRTALLGRIGEDVRAFQLAYLIGFAGYGALLLAVRRSVDAGTLGSWRWWFCGCVLLRIMLLGAEPSDDAYRYVWEGRVQLAGFNPFEHPPTDDALADLRNEDWAKINHPDYPAIYPPLAQMEFAAVAAVWPSIYAIKAVHVVWDVMTLLVIGACLARAGRVKHWLIVYGACPLVLAAFGVEGHVDSLMLVLVMTCVWAVLDERMWLAGACCGLAISAKLIPIVLVPWLLFRHFRATLVAGTVVVATYLPYLGAGKALFASLLRWSGNEEFFGLLRTFHITEFATGAERAIVAATLALSLLTLAWRIRAFPRYAAAAAGAVLLLSPIVHYWYLTWVLVLLPLGVRWRWLVAAMAMAGYFEASWYHETGGEWYMPPWPKYAMWLPFTLAWLTESVFSRRAKALHKPPPTERP